MPLGNGVLSIHGHSRPGETGQSKPKQAMILRLSAESVAALDGTLSGGVKPNIQFTFGAESGLHIGDKYFPMMAPRKEDTTHELYLRASAPNKPPSNSLKLYANVVGKFTVAREFDDEVGEDIKGRSLAAEQRRNERRIIVVDAPPPDLSTGTTRKKKAVAPSNMFRKPLPAADHKPRPSTTNAQPARLASPLPPPAKDGAQSLHLRLVHFLASSPAPRTFEDIRRLVGGNDRDLLHILDEIAEHPRTASSSSSKNSSDTPYVLKPQSWLEVRPFSWPGLSENARTNMARSGRLALQGCGIKSTDPVWEFFKYRAPSGPSIPVSGGNSLGAPSPVDATAKTEAGTSSTTSKRGTAAKEKKAKPKAKQVAKSKDTGPILMKDESKPRPSGSGSSTPVEVKTAAAPKHYSVSGNALPSQNASSPPPRKTPGSGYRASSVTGSGTRPAMNLPASLPPKPSPSTSNRLAPPPPTNGGRLSPGRTSAPGMSPSTSSSSSTSRNPPMVATSMAPSPLRRAHSPLPPHQEQHARKDAAGISTSSLSKSEQSRDSSGRDNIVRRDIEHDRGRHRNNEARDQARERERDRSVDTRSHPRALTVTEEHNGRRQQGSKGKEREAHSNGGGDTARDRRENETKTEERIEAGSRSRERDVKKEDDVDNERNRERELKKEDRVNSRDTTKANRSDPRDRQREQDTKKDTRLDLKERDRPLTTTKREERVESRGPDRDSKREDRVDPRDRQRDVKKEERPDREHDRLQDTTTSKRRKHEDDEDSASRSAPQKRRKTEPVEPSLRRTRADYEEGEEELSSQRSGLNKRRKTELPHVPVSTALVKGKEKETPSRALLADDSNNKLKAPLPKIKKESSPLRSMKKEKDIASPLPMSREISGKSSTTPQPSNSSSSKANGSFTRAASTSTSSSGPRFRRQRSSAQYTSSEDEGEIRETLPVIAPPPSPLSTDHEALRAHYDKLYIEHVNLYQKTVMQRMKVQSLMKRMQDDRSSVTDSDGDGEMLEPDALREAQARYQMLRDELLRIQKVFETPV